MILKNKNTKFNFVDKSLSANNSCNMLLDYIYLKR